MRSKFTPPLWCSEVPPFPEWNTAKHCSHHHKDIQACNTSWQIGQRAVHDLCTQCPIGRLGFWVIVYLWLRNQQCRYAMLICMMASPHVVSIEKMSLNYSSWLENLYKSPCLQGVVGSVISVPKDRATSSHSSLFIEWKQWTAVKPSGILRANCKRQLKWSTLLWSWAVE